MKRGTTPTHKFELPFEIPEGSKYRVVYAQGIPPCEKIILERTDETCETTGNTIIIKLTAEETLLFDQTPHQVGSEIKPFPVAMQIGVDLSTGGKMWSDIMTTDIDRLLREDGVI